MPDARLKRTREAYHGVLDIGCLCGACCAERGRRLYPDVWASPLHKQYMEAKLDLVAGVDWYMDPHIGVPPSSPLSVGAGQTGQSIETRGWSAKERK